MKTNELNEIIESQKLQINALNDELEALYAIFSNFEAITLETQKKDFRTSNLYFKNLVDLYQEKKPKISKLQISKKLGISQGRLYEIMNGKRTLPESVITKATDLFELSTEDSEQLKKLAADDILKKKYLRENITQHMKKRLLSTNEDKTVTHQGSLESIKEWDHYGILALFELENIEYSPDLFSAILGISKTELERYIQELIDLGFLHQNKKGQLFLNQIYTHSDNNNNTLSLDDLKNLHLSYMSKAQSIYINRQIPYKNIEDFYFTGHTFCGDKSKIPLAKKMLQEFNFKLVELLTSDKKDHVFLLNSFFSPIE